MVVYCVILHNVAEKTYLEQLGITKHEAMSVLYIVDLQPGETPVPLEKITVGNLDVVLEQAIAQYNTHREYTYQTYEAFSDERSPLQTANIVEQMSSQSHAIQCALSGIVDYGKFVRHWDRYAATHELTDSEAALAVREKAVAQIHCNEVLKELFQIDIWLKVGQLKKDSAFSESAIIKYEEITPKVLEILDELLAVYGDADGSITAYRNRIQQISTEQIPDRLYNDVCIALSDIQFKLFEETKTEWHDNICAAMGVAPGTKEKNPFYTQRSQDIPD